MAATSTIPHTGWRHLTSADTSIASNNNNFSAMNALDIILQRTKHLESTPPSRQSFPIVVQPR
jgi:hypothetical protein